MGYGKCVVLHFSGVRPFLPRDAPTVVSVYLSWAVTVADNYYNRFTAPWTLSGTTRVNRYQKGKTRKVKQIWIYWSKK